MCYNKFTKTKEVFEMEYSQIILEMLERIKVLENKVKGLEEERGSCIGAKAVKIVDFNKISSKYRALAEYLLTEDKKTVSLTYDEIEKILGFELPDTARKFKQSFWANTKTHSYASSWLELGYKAKVNVDSDIVTFIKNTL